MTRELKNKIKLTGDGNATYRRAVFIHIYKVKYVYKQTWYTEINDYGNKLRAI